MIGLYLENTPREAGIACTHFTDRKSQGKKKQSPRSSLQKFSVCVSHEEDCSLLSDMGDLARL